MSEIYIKLELGPDVNIWIKADDLADTSSTMHAVVTAIASDRIIEIHDDSTTNF